MQTATGQSSIKMTTMTSTKRQPAADGTATSTMISWEKFLICSLCRSLLVKTVAMTARFQFCWWIRTGPLHAEESTCINLLFDVKCVILIPTDLNLHWQDMHAIAVAAAGPFLKHLILFQGTCEGKCESQIMFSKVWASLLVSSTPQILMAWTSEEFPIRGFALCAGLLWQIRWTEVSLGSTGFPVSKTTILDPFMKFFVIFLVGRF